MLTPDEAARFTETDEDPDAIHARFDTSPHGTTRRPGYDPREQITVSVRWITSQYGKETTSV